MRRYQRGAVTLVVGLIILGALAVIGVVGARLVLTQHRISTNSVHADAAFAAAESGVQNAVAYLNANRNTYASSTSGGWKHASSAPKWTACTSGQATRPCGDTSTNLYDTTWQYYGPLPNQQATGSGYSTSTWLLSNTLSASPQTIPYLSCLSLGLTSLVSSSLLSGLNSVLSNLVSATAGQAGFGVPASPCLPINFSQMPRATTPSRINPSLTAMSVATTSDPLGGSASVQQVLATASLFANTPPAAIMVAGTANLYGDIRVWGNMRPPTVAPMDFSVLNLNNVAGLNVTSLLNSLIGSQVAAITNTINVNLSPLLNTTTTEVLAFNWNVTFPLSIWSADDVTLGRGLLNKNNSSGLLGTLLNGVLGGLVNSLGLGLNLNNLLDLGGNLQLLSSARTCLPTFDGTAASPCTPLSQSLLPTTSNCTLAVAGLCVTANISQGALLPLKLPDVQDDVNLVSAVTGLIGTGVPAFPGDLFDFTFGYPSAQSALVQQIADQPANCNAIGASGLYWVAGNCALSGTFGSATAPVTLITTGTVTLAAGTEFWGVIYLRGNAAKTVSGATSGARPLVRGALLSEGALTANNDFSVVYDVNVIRAAGFRAGSFVPMPGGWNDVLAAP